MKLIRVIIPEQPNIFDDWLKRFVSEQQFARVFHLSLQSKLLHLTSRDYDSRRRYELKRGSDTVVELERMPLAGGLEICLNRLIGLAHEQPTIDLENDRFTTNPADAGFFRAFCREINTIYEPEWFDLPKLSGLSSIHVKRRLNSLQLAELINYCCAVETFEIQMLRTSDIERRVKLKGWIAAAQRELPPFPPQEATQPEKDEELSGSHTDLSAKSDALKEPATNADKKEWVRWRYEMHMAGRKNEATWKIAADKASCNPVDLCGRIKDAFDEEYPKYKERLAAYQTLRQRPRRKA